MAARKRYSRKKYTGNRRGGNSGSHLVKQTPEQKILEHLLSIKEQVLEREVLPFDVGRFNRMPHNAFTRHQYGGFYNLLMIMIRSFQNGWDDPRFVTVGKAKEIGAEFKGREDHDALGPRIHQGDKRGHRQGGGSRSALPHLPRVQHNAVRKP